MFAGTWSVPAEQHAIVEVETGYFFGASADGKWIAAKAAAKSTRDGTSFRVYGLTAELAQTKISKAKSVDEPCADTMEVKLSAKPKGGVIALAAPWNALPRKPHVADTRQKVYVDLVRDFLKGRGIRDPKVKIKSILRVDLDGDGEEEVLISATDYHSNGDGVPESAPAGSYSMVILRQVVKGTVRTRLVAGEFYPTPKDFSPPNYYNVIATLDLDGDGKLEVIVHSAYYEGASTTIYRCRPTKIEPLLSVECGV